MLKAEQRLGAILKKAKHYGVPPESLENLEVVKLMCEKKGCSNLFRLHRFTYVGIVLALFLYGSSFVHFNSKCLVKMPPEASKIFREPENCDMCRVSRVDKVKNLSSEDFDGSYASKVRPVVITDGTRDWTAPKVFNFDFFKNIYQKSDSSKIECQFFPYKTEFDSLEEVFNMSEARTRLEPGTKPWYIGWSNCNDDAGKELRKHFRRPYFLHKTSENIALSWIFMGGPGAGAHMHVDNVQYPSWQAQLSGRKTWKLAPPPECIYSCSQMKVTVEPGEIIVVDTNRWYHQTHILPGDISITVGSEFD